MTVVIPCFNGGSYLAEAIESVLAQTMPQLELIVVDDGSSDASPRIAQTFAEGDARVQIRHQPNAGVAAARNRGAALALAPVIAFLDADDRWHREFLARTLAALDADPSAGVTFARCRIVDEAGRPTGQVTRPKLDDIGLADLLESNPTATCSNLVVRKTVFTTVGGFRIGMDRAEDQEWLFRVRAAGFVLKGVDPVLVDYRTSAHGLSSELQRMLEAWEAFVAIAREIAPGAVEVAYREARAGHLRYLARRAVRLGRPPREALRFLTAALQTDPTLAFRRPRQVGGVFVAMLARALSLRPSA